MRGLLAGLIVALIIVLLALFVAALGAVGVAAIGLLLSRWFDLSQWQGSLIALAVALIVGLGVYQLTNGSAAHIEPDWIEWEDVSEDEDDDEDVAAEPPIVPWRRQRPTQGTLPKSQPQQKRSRRK